MTIKSALAACALVALSTGAFAKVPETPTQKPAAALAAQGAKPGDDAMTCDQISAEMKPYMGQIQSMALAMQADAEAVSGHKKSTARGAPLNMALGLVGMLVPGMGLATHGTELAQQPQKQREAAALAEQMAPLLENPRFERLLELGQAKCQGAQSAP